MRILSCGGDEMLRCWRVPPTLPHALAVILLFVVACAGLNGCSRPSEVLEEAATSTAPSIAQLTIAEVAPELAVFGDLAAIEASPVTTDVDSAGGELNLAEGALVTVPAGAFVEETSLTVTDGHHDRLER